MDVLAIERLLFFIPLNLQQQTQKVICFTILRFININNFYSKLNYFIIPIFYNSIFFIVQMKYICITQGNNFKIINIGEQILLN